MKTKVIFRMLNNECIALFPEILGTNNPYTCLNYMHLGQHGSGIANTGNTKPAKPHQYRELEKELTLLGYNLKVIKKFSYSHLITRKSQLPL